MTYIVTFDCFDKSLIVLSATSCGVSIASFASVISAPIWITSASFSFAFSLTTGIIKKLVKITGNKKKKHSNFVMLASSKPNSIESKISKALIDSEIRYGDFTTITKEEGNYRKLKESITMMKSQRRDIERSKLIEDGKRIGTDQIIRKNERINNSLKSQV